MNILVTGGAGFIGSHLCERLLRRGNKVVCLDNFISGKIENIHQLFCIYPATFQLVVGDIRKLSDCRKALKGIQCVFHLAAIGPDMLYDADCSTSKGVNVDGFVNMLAESSKAGVRRFIYASCSSAYGNCRADFLSENLIGSPLSEYGASKMSNEYYAHEYSKNYGIETIGLRYFSVFGRSLNVENIYSVSIPILAKKLLQHGDITIPIDSHSPVELTYIENVVNVSLLAINTVNPEAINQVFNIASGEQTTLNILVSYLKEFLTGCDPKVNETSVIYLEEKYLSPYFQWASIDKASRILGYKPVISVREGVENTLRSYFPSCF